MSNDIQVITLLKWGMFQVYAFCFALGPLFNTNIYIYTYIFEIFRPYKKKLIQSINDDPLVSHPLKTPFEAALRKAYTLNPSMGVGPIKDAL